MDLSSPRILVIDHHPIVREGIVSVLSAAFVGTEVTEFGCFQEALAHLDKKPAGFVVSDFRVKGETLISFLREINGKGCKIRCLILSALDEIQAGYPGIKAGASGFVGKCSPTTQIVDAVKTIMAGRHYVSERLAKALMESRGSDAQPSAGTQLTSRELQIFALIGETRSVSLIASQLGLSVKTVETHRENIKNKLGHQSAGQLAAAAVRWLDANPVAI